MEKITMNTTYTDTGFGCTCNLLQGWVVTGSKDFDKFQKYVKESLDFYLECCRADGEAYPEVFDGDYQIEYQFDTRALLQYLQPTLTLASISRATGIKERQLSDYATGDCTPRAEQSHRIVNGVHNLAQQLAMVRA